MRKRIKIKLAELVGTTDSELARVLSQLKKYDDITLPTKKRNALSFFSKVGKNYDESRSVGEGTL